MRKATSMLIVMVLGLFAMFAAVPAVQAEERQCTGTIGAITLDNIFVPDGQSCVLNGTQAIGTVKVGTGATLDAIGVRVNGNIQAEGAQSVTVRGGSFVGGSVQIKQGQSANINATTINGDLQFDEQRGALWADHNTIGSNLQAVKNTGGLSITNNRIAQNLQCKENNPAPTGGNNTAGSKEDQCSGL